MEMLHKLESGEAPPRERDVNRYVARRLRARRILSGLTQQRLADIVGISAQQIHKYETAACRISIGRLFEIADVLGVGIVFFFEGLNKPQEFESSLEMKNLAELIGNFNAVPSLEHKVAICRMARLFAHDEDR